MLMLDTFPLTDLFFKKGCYLLECLEVEESFSALRAFPWIGKRAIRIAAGLGLIFHEMFQQEIAALFVVSQHHLIGGFLVLHGVRDRWGTARRRGAAG